MMKSLKSLFIVLATCGMTMGMASAQTCSSYPNTLTNGQNADANQVMANFNFILSCLNSQASSGGAFGFRNRVINPSGQINQIGSGTAADGSYWFDQWVVLTQSSPITPSQITNVENGTPFMMRYTQSNIPVQRFGIIQPIENADIIDARGQAVTLSARVRMSTSTILRYAILEWTGTADAITKDVVNDWTNGSFTPGNFFISSNLAITAIGSTSVTANSLTSISLSGTVSGAMNNVLVFFWTDSTQAQNVTLDIGKVQLELAQTASPLAFRSINEELQLCARYFEVVGMTITTENPPYSNTGSYNAQKRATPVFSVVGGSLAGATVGVIDGNPLNGMRQITPGSQFIDVSIGVNARL